jgi:ribonuclease P protein component
MRNIRNTFRKSERISGELSISRLFEKGNSFLVYPVKVVWMKTDSAQPYPVRAAFAVSRKLFRNAPDRNLLRRRMREAYRLHKANFYTSCGSQKFLVIFIYIARDQLSFEIIENGVKSALRKLLVLNSGR